MKKILIFLIKCYQCIISPYLGSCCRFYPSCSHYALEAIEAFGAFKGTFLAVKRVCKCHPLHPGGYDPIPQTKGKTARKFFSRRLFSFKLNKK